MERAMTEQERAELEGDLAGLSQQDSLLPVLIASVLSAGVGFVLGSILASLARWLVGPRLEPLPITLAVGAAAGVLATGVWDLLRRNRKRRQRAEDLARDLAHGRVEEVMSPVTGLHRFQEPEHFTELLILTCADGRLRAVLDDTTTNTEGDKPRRSTLKLGRQMTALRFPASGTERTRFEGDPLRRPKAVPSDPRTWPEEGWITPDALARIDGAGR